MRKDMFEAVMRQPAADLFRHDLFGIILVIPITDSRPTQSLYLSRFGRMKASNLDGRRNVGVQTAIDAKERKRIALIVQRGNNVEIWHVGDV